MSVCVFVYVYSVRHLSGGSGKVLAVVPAHHCCLHTKDLPPQLHNFTNALCRLIPVVQIRKSLDWAVTRAAVRHLHIPQY